MAKVKHRSSRPKTTRPVKRVVKKAKSGLDKSSKDAANKTRNIATAKVPPVKPLIIRDPVHDLIRIECPYARALIHTEPFQRLRRIKQLGLANLVYPGAEHSRFNHSLGVYHLAHQAMEAIDQNLVALGKPRRFDPTEPEGKHHRLLLGLAALLHDIGHGPFSHQFERVVKDLFEEHGQKKDYRKHEKWATTIIEQHPEVHSILEGAAKDTGFHDLAEEIVQVIRGEYTPDFIVDLLSSQMDVDRFDYLMRDSRSAGCHYGDFDLRWILRSLLIWDLDPQAMRRLGGVEEEDTEGAPESTAVTDSAKSRSPASEVRPVLVVHDQKGRNCVEEYILGRHYMYTHLYYHKTIAGAEALMKSILKRAATLLAENKLPGSYPALATFSRRENPTIDEYLALDDHVVMGWVRAWAGEDGVDSTLRDLSRRMVKRDLFSRIVPPKSAPKSRAAYKALLEMLRRTHEHAEFYLLEVELSDSAHKDYLYHIKEEGKKPEDFRDIYIFNPDLAQAPVIKLGDMAKSSVVIAGSGALRYDETLWFVPRESHQEAESIVAKFR